MFFNFLGSDFLAPKSSHRREKQPALGPDKPVALMDVKVSNDNTLADGLIERTSPMLDEIELKTMHKYEEGDQQRKKK